MGQLLVTAFFKMLASVVGVPYYFLPVRDAQTYDKCHVHSLNLSLSLVAATV